MNIKTAKNNLRDIFIKDLDDCGEANSKLNNASRALIVAMHEECGEVWLGCINRYNDKMKLQPYIYKWNGEQVYNFGSDFALPKFDEMLEALLKLWEQQSSHQLADMIFRRIEEIGGYQLHWS